MTDNAWSRVVSPTFPIGTWVHREAWKAEQATPDGRVRATVRLTTLSHYVESLVADEPVTRCGRRLKLIPGTTLRYEADTERACYRCKR